MKNFYVIIDDFRVCIIFIRFKDNMWDIAGKTTKRILKPFIFQAIAWNQIQENLKYPVFNNKINIPR